MDTYKQCKLTHKNIQQTAWIPSDLAVVNKLLVIAKGKDKIGPMWKVVEVYDKELTRDELPNTQHKFHRSNQKVLNKRKKLF